MPLGRKQKELVAFVEDGFGRVTGRKADYSKGERSENVLIGCNYGIPGHVLWSRSREDGAYIYLSIVREYWRDPGKSYEVPKGPMVSVEMRTVDTRKFTVPRVNATFDLSDNDALSRFGMSLVYSGRFLTDAESAFRQLKYGATADDFVKEVHENGAHRFYQSRARGRNVTMSLPGKNFAISLTLPEYIAPPVHGRTKRVLAAAEKTIRKMRNL